MSALFYLMSAYTLNQTEIVATGRVNITYPSTPPHQNLTKSLFIDSGPYQSDILSIKSQVFCFNLLYSCEYSYLILAFGNNEEVIVSEDDDK